MDVNVEGGFAPAVLDELKRRGHKIVELAEGYMDFGSAQLIWKLDGGYFAASDPRRDGQAVGF
jgi:gamma-glutamyltranspeptidase/glutathione hydrolase